MTSKDEHEPVINSQAEEASSEEDLSTETESSSEDEDEKLQVQEILNNNTFDELESEYRSVKLRMKLLQKCLNEIIWK